MDGLVRNIYSSIEQNQHLKKTLLVLCGDHGMNDAGNHGGAAEGETSPALVFISPMMKSITTGFDSPSRPKSRAFDYHTQVEQSDIAPTLAGLLGFPVPLNNLGVFIPNFLPFWRPGGCNLFPLSLIGLVRVPSIQLSRYRFSVSASDGKCPTNLGHRSRCFSKCALRPTSEWPWMRSAIVRRNGIEMSMAWCRGFLACRPSCVLRHHRESPRGR